MRSLSLVCLMTILSVAVPALCQDPWSESVTNWSLVPHDPAASRPSAINLRLDTAFKMTGTASLAFDMVSTNPVVGYTEVRLTFAQPLNARDYDRLHVAYHVPSGMKPTRFYVVFTAPDWKSGVNLPESIRPKTGGWQDIVIPITQFANNKPGNVWKWDAVGNLLIEFFWDEGIGKKGTVHIDNIRLEKTGKGIGNTKAPPAILFLDFHAPNKDIDATHRQAIESKGFTVVWDLLQNQTWASLSRFNVVVLGLHPEIDVNKPGDWVESMAGKRALLEQYVAQGGGLFVSTTPGSKGAGVGINALMEPMGLSIVNEQVTESNSKRVVQQEQFPNMEFACTDNVTKDPLTDGVTGMWYCTSVQFTGGGGGSFTATMRPGAGWKTLINASATAASHPFKGAFGIDIECSSLTSAPPLCAVKAQGKGRVAVLTMNPTHHWMSGYHPWWDGLVMSKGAEGRPSQLERLMLNLYEWLAQPSLAGNVIGGYIRPEPITGARYLSAGEEHPVIDYAKKKLPPPSPYQHVGLIGAHSAFSDGQGSVAEWVAAARKAGYDWIAFTELHSKMNQAKWEQLKMECARMTTNTFCAIPGMELIDKAGNHSLVLAPIPWPDQKLENDRMDLPQGIGYAYNFPAQVQFRFHEGLAPWYRNMFHFAGAFTYRDGKLVDDGEKEFYELAERTFNIWPVAIHEVFRPEELAKERHNGYQTIYTYGPLQDMDKQFCFPSYNYFFHHDFVYISSGPFINRFSVPGNGTSYFDIPPEYVQVNAELARNVPGADRWRIIAYATASNGIADVRIMDGGNPLRRFAGLGKDSFQTVIDGYHDRQYCFGLEVTDKQGGRAMAFAASSSAGRHWFGNCSDNVNIMEGGTYGTLDRAPRGYECYFPRWGYWLCPSIYIEGNQPLNLPHNERLRFASTDCTIVDHLFTMTHDMTVPNVGGGRMMRPLYPIKDFECRTRLTRFTAGVDTPEFAIIEPRLTLKRDVTVAGGPFPNFRLLFMHHGKPMAKGDFVFTALTPTDGRTLVEAISETNGWPRVSHFGTLPVGGYAGAFPNYTGAGAVFALEPDTQFAVEGNAQSRRIQIGRDIPAKTVLKAGTVISRRVLYMEGRWRQMAGNVEIETARKLLGLNGPPGYTVTPSVGQVSDTLFACTLKTDKGAFRAKFSKAPLPLDLPIMVPGLNPQRDAGVWIVGTERVRHFGLFEGTGYTTLRLDQGAVEAFIGHPVMCDADDLYLSLVEADAKQLQVSVHNPTGKVIKTRIWKNAGFELGPPLDKMVEAPAGQTIEIKVPADADGAGPTKTNVF